MSTENYLTNNNKDVYRFLCFKKQMIENRRTNLINIEEKYNTTNKELLSFSEKQQEQKLSKSDISFLLEISNYYSDFYQRFKTKSLFNININQAELVEEMDNYLTPKLANIKIDDNIDENKDESFDFRRNNNCVLSKENFEIERLLFFLSRNVFFPSNENTMDKFLLEFRNFHINLKSFSHPDILENEDIMSNSNNFNFIDNRNTDFYYRELDNKKIKAYSLLKYLSFDSLINYFQASINEGPYKKSLLEVLSFFVIKIQNVLDSSISYDTFNYIRKNISSNDYFLNSLLHIEKEVVNMALPIDIKELITDIATLVKYPSDLQISKNLIREKINVIFKISNGDILSSVLLYKVFIEFRVSYSSIINEFRSIIISNNQTSLYYNNNYNINETAVTQNNYINYFNKVLLESYEEIFLVKQDTITIPFWIKLMLCSYDDIINTKNHQSHDNLENIMRLFLQSFIKNKNSSMAIFNSFTIAIKDKNINSYLKKSYYINYLQYLIDIVFQEQDILKLNINNNISIDANIALLDTIYEKIYESIVEEEKFITTYFPFSFGFIKKLVKCFFLNIHDNREYIDSKKNKFDLISHIIIILENSCHQYEVINKIKKNESLLFLFKDIINEYVLFPYLGFGFNSKEQIINIDNCSNLYESNIMFEMYKNCYIVDSTSNNNVNINTSLYSFKIFSLIECLNLSEYLEENSNNKNAYCEDSPNSKIIVNCLLRIFDFYFYANNKEYILPEFLFPCISRFVVMLIYSKRFYIDVERINLLLSKMISYSNDIVDKFFTMDKKYGLFEYVLFNESRKDAFNEFNFLSSNAICFDKYKTSCNNTVSSILINNPFFLADLKDEDVK